MMFFKKYKKIFYPIVLIVFLAFIYWWGGNSPVLRGFNVNEEPTAVTEEKSDKERYHNGIC